MQQGPPGPNGGMGMSGKKGEQVCIRGVFLHSFHCFFHCKLLVITEPNYWFVYFCRVHLERQELLAQLDLKALRYEPYVMFAHIVWPATCTTFHTKWPGVGLPPLPPGICFQTLPFVYCESDFTTQWSQLRLKPRKPTYTMPLGPFPPTTK